LEHMLFDLRFTVVEVMEEITVAEAEKNMQIVGGHESFVDRPFLQMYISNILWLYFL